MRSLTFDPDGTLIASRQDLINSVNAILQHFGRLELPAEAIVAYVGEGLSLLVRRALGDPEGRALLRDATEFFLAYMRFRISYYFAQNTALTTFLPSLSPPLTFLDIPWQRQPSHYVDLAGAADTYQ